MTARSRSARPRVASASRLRPTAASRSTARASPRATPTGATRRKGARVIVVASNLTIVAADTGAPVIEWSDPEPLGDADRASVVFVVHSVFGGSTGFTLAFWSEISNDGAHWVQAGVNFSTTSAPVATSRVRPNAAELEVKFHADFPRSRWPNPPTGVVV